MFLMSNLLTVNAPRYRSPLNYQTQTLDFHEDDKQYTVTFDLPGVGKENIAIEALGNRLRIATEWQDETQTLARRRFQNFQRILTLPEGVLADQVQANYQDGVLSLEIPKPAEAKPHRISVGPGKTASLPS